MMLLHDTVCPCVRDTVCPCVRDTLCKGHTASSSMHDSDEPHLIAREQHKRAPRRSCAHIARPASFPRTSRHTASALCPMPRTCMHTRPRTTHARTQIFMDFCARKEAVLFATDLAGRGLDFPEVDWVIQLDCPEVRIAPPPHITTRGCWQSPLCMPAPARNCAPALPRSCVLLFASSFYRGREGSWR